MSYAFWIRNIHRFAKTINAFNLTQILGLQLLPHFNTLIKCVKDGVTSE